MLKNIQVLIKCRLQSELYSPQSYIHFEDTQSLKVVGLNFAIGQ